MKTVDIAKLKSAVGHSPYSWHQIYKGAQLNRSTYRYWSGQREMPLEVALKIAYYIKVPAKQFLTEEALMLVKNTLGEL